MKILKNLALNSDFHNKYISLIRSNNNIKNLVQLVSFITALGIWYSLAHSKLEFFFGWWAWIPAIVFGVVVAFGVEWGLRKYLPYAVKAVVYRRWKKEEGTISWYVIPICVALLFFSGWTSFEGSYSVVETVAPDVELQTTSTVDSVYQSKTEENKSLFQSDSTTIATSYNKQIIAARTKYSARETSFINKAEQFKQRAQRMKGKANKDYLLVLAGREESKADIETSKKDSVISELETLKAAKLLSLLDARRNDKVSRDTTYQAHTNKITASNESAIEENRAMIDSYGLGLGWVTVVCLLILIGLIVIDVVFEKGSGIKERVIFSQYDLLPPVWDRWTNYINMAFLGTCHRKLDEWESNLEPPNLPTPEPPLYYINAQEQKKIAVTNNQYPTPPIEGEEKLCNPIAYEFSSNLSTESTRIEETTDFTENEVTASDNTDNENDISVTVSLQNSQNVDNQKHIDFFRNQEKRDRGYCKNCNKRIPIDKKVTAKFCSDSCKTADYKKRKKASG